MGSSDPSFRSVWLSPRRWYLAALFPIAIGIFMYALESSDWERLRLRDPVPVMDEFATAECITIAKVLIATACTSPTHSSPRRM
jgi:hypothetical protein